MEFFVPDLALLRLLDRDLEVPQVDARLLTFRSWSKLTFIVARPAVIMT